MKSSVKWLILFFAIALSFRLFFAFHSSTFTGDEAYFNLRQAEAIRTEGHPLFHDSLSYGGRTFIFLPFFHYILAFFSLFMPLALVGKIIPNVFASCLVFVIYLISMHITNDNRVSLFTAFVSIFIPIYLTETINKVSVLSLLIPLFFLMIYFLLELKKYSTFFVFGCFILSLVSPFASVLAIALIVHLLLAKIEDLGIEGERFESILFFVFILVWMYILVFKDVFLANGSLVIWQNIPASLLDSYFASANVIELMLLIGIVPFICGIYAVYRYFFVEKSRAVFMFTALAITVFVLLFFKLITPSTGAVFLGITLVVLLAPCLHFLFDYFSKTKFSRYTSLLAIIIFIIFLLNSIVPSFIYADVSMGQSVDESDIKALGWIRDNTPENSTVLASLEMGNLVSAIAKRKNVVDTNFMMIDDASTRLDDISTIYNSKFETIATTLLTKYGVNYIYLKDGNLSYADSACFKLVYADAVKIYKVECEMR